MENLKSLTEALEQCDKVILNGLLMRNRIVEDMVSYKEANGIPILQPGQEAKLREWLKEETKGKGDAYTMGYRQRSESPRWLLTCKLIIWHKNLFFLQGRHCWQLQLLMLT